MDYESLAVSEAIHPKDQMYTGNMARYLDVGRSALRNIDAILDLTGVRPRRILDYACGCGRVCRQLRARFPTAEIVASDLMEHGVAFCAEHFGAIPHRPSPDFKAVSFEEGFDLIWSGSLMTHVDEAKAMAMIDMMVRSLKPGGVAIWTTHGRYVETLERAGKWPYPLAPDVMAGLAAAFRDGRYGYTDYSHMKGYGISITPLTWLVRALEGRDGIRIVGLAERGWDNHQDVVAIQNRPVSG